MRKYGIVLFVLGCIALGQMDAFASCVSFEDVPFDFASVAPVHVGERSPLEQRIHDLEWLMQNNGKSTPLDDSTFYATKLELAALYDQLPREHNSLDDGSDTCPATVLPAGIVPYTDFGTTVGAVNNFSSVGCGGNTAPDKIYSYTPNQAGWFVFDTFGSNFDTQLYIRTGGACPGSSEVICNDDAFGPQSQVTVFLNSSQTYYVIVDGFQSYSGNFALHISGSCIIGFNNDWQQECPESPGDPMHAVWDCNGGCNNQWNGGFGQWQQVNLCQFMRGTCFTYQDPNNFSARDIDSYYFTLTEPCSLRLNLLAEFSYNVQINDYGFCPGINFVSLLNIPVCNGGTYITQCLPAGTYTIEISPNFYIGMTTPESYLFSIEPIPCSGCRIDASFIAPASFTANGCDGISHNSLRPSNDATYCVVIPYASDWTFSLCGSPNWNSWIYLTNQCNGGIIAQDNDGCSPNGLSKIECVSLMPGNYYFTIEGFNNPDCGQFYVSVTSCQGSCCYGDMWNPSCANTTQSECEILGGNFDLGGTCTPGLCYPRPGCDAPSAFSQQPHVPDENWTALASDNYLVNRVWENYNATGFIKAVRFWGLSIDYNTGIACTEQPGSFEITFVDSSNGPQVQTYNVQAFGLPLLQNYGANYVMTEYNVDLPTLCPIQNGRISIRGSDNDACVWHWATSPQGNGSVVLVNSGGAINLARDMAICLEKGCPKPDSLVISIFNVPDGFYQLNLHVSLGSFVTLAYSDSINAVYPATYLPIYSGWLSAGNYGFVEPMISTNRRFIAIADCSEPAMEMKESESQTEPEE
ncbi:MAG: hypothetical protein IPP40_13305 [bacterium]|nr:hypothetical protein [bacterium]